MVDAPLFPTDFSKSSAAASPNGGAVKNTNGFSALGMIPDPAKRQC